MLAYYVEWHMRRKLKPLLLDDEDAEGPAARRTSVVALATISMSALAKADGKRNSDGDPVHSFSTLIGDLATITRNTVAPRLPGHHTAHAAPEEGVQTPGRDAVVYPARRC